MIAGNDIKNDLKMYCLGIDTIENKETIEDFTL